MKNTLTGIMWKYLVGVSIVFNLLHFGDCALTSGKRKTTTDIAEEVDSFRYSLEQKYYETYKLDKKSFKGWFDVHLTPDHVCNHFLQKVLITKKELSLVTGQIQEVKLYYTQIQDTVDIQEIGPLTIKAMQCRLPNLIKGLRFVYLVKSPSYPDCVFLLTKILNIRDGYYISEEICESTNFISSYRIISTDAHNAMKNLRRGHDGFEKREMYEGLHIQYNLAQPRDCELWRELEQINKEDICQALLSQVYPRLIKKLVIEVGSEQLLLKYCTRRSDTKELIPMKKVMALKCSAPDKKPPNHLWFIKVHKANCVYWVRKVNAKLKYYFITKELCLDEPLSTEKVDHRANVAVS